MMPFIYKAASSEQDASSEPARFSRCSKHYLHRKGGPEDPDYPHADSAGRVQIPHLPRPE